MYYVLAVNPLVSLFSSSLDTTISFNILFHCYSLCCYRFSHNAFQLLLEISETSTNTHTFPLLLSFSVYGICMYLNFIFFPLFLYTTKGVILSRISKTNTIQNVIKFSITKGCKFFLFLTHTHFLLSLDAIYLHILLSSFSLLS
jgi:hypothetical protein